MNSELSVSKRHHLFFHQKINKSFPLLVSCLFLTKAVLFEFISPPCESTLYKAGSILELERNDMKNNDLTARTKLKPAQGRVTCLRLMLSQSLEEHVLRVMCQAPSMLYVLHLI